MSGDHNMYCSGNQPDSEAVKLAKDLGCEIPSGPEGREFFFYPKELEAFYCAAFNAGLEAAAKRVGVWDTSFQTGGSFAAAIRELKEEV